jgi:PhnB protein
VGDQVLNGSDTAPAAYLKPQGFTVAIGMKDVAEAERVFAALSEGGAVQMPLQETFWAHRFGYLVDRFGTPWMINCEKPM